MEPRKTEFTIDRPRSNGAGFMAAYFPVNDPLVPLSLLPTYDKARVDVIELGIKTENPFADGEIVASSMKRSSGSGTLCEAGGAIATVRAFEHNALGMIFAYADAKLTADPAEWNKVDALLCLGQPGADSVKLTADARAHGTRITTFVPYDLPARAIGSALAATGFVMVQYTSGQTGIRTALDDKLSGRLKVLRGAGVRVPILTGVGISSRAQVTHAMENGADGIVIGSGTLQKAVESPGALEDYLCEMREVLDGR